MASDYGLNFGFRRSDESNATREGRFKTPTTPALLIGTAVELNPASAGYLKQSANAAVPLTGVHGLLVQEESHIQGSIFASRGVGLEGHDSIDLGTAKVDQLSVMWGGPSKVWLKNTLAYSRAGRTKSAITMFTAAGVAVGDGLGWDGSKWVENSTQTWMRVTYVDLTVTGAEYCEAVLTF